MAFRSHLMCMKARVMCDFMEGNAQLFRPGQRVLELGAGTGLVGMVAASLGATVTLTDLASVVSFMQRNADANPSFVDNVTVLPLQWGDDVSEFVGRYDVVLARYGRIARTPSH
jgi:predicted nicotinamide N-methyase